MSLPEKVKNSLIALSSESIYARGEQIEPYLSTIASENGTYGFTFYGTKAVHCVTVKSNGYANCAPCFGFMVRAVCAHTIAALIRMGRTESEETMMKVVKTLMDKQLQKGEEFLETN